MISTLEVRWFYHGSIPPGIAAWFEQSGHWPAKQPERVDHYLRQPSDGMLGIKLREGRIEIKQRIRQLGATRFHDQAIGILEQWRKWSFPLAEANGPLARALESSSAWQSVRKERWLRRYCLTEGRTIAATSTHEWPQRGTDFELTSVRFQDQSWWTLGLEAFGLETHLAENLALMTSSVLAGKLPLPLASQDSYGYPAWLEKVGLANNESHSLRGQEIPE